jgi:hypothetical protein
MTASTASSTSLDVTMALAPDDNVPGGAEQVARQTSSVNSR